MRLGSCFRETTLDGSDGDSGGGDVPRYPYAICMEENMRTPVYNLAVADGGSPCEIHVCVCECTMLTETESTLAGTSVSRFVALLLVNDIPCCLSQPPRCIEIRR